ncbi:discoidin domain-containing protein [Streptantibioticus silvisoli]|uniref:Discoidin domain-containing protein n=1 Tax=Streptantibioticus silvisoli TaxID=2705255 RepID=A0ABT6W729_9ACTN|nr:discoidin domain-containing protein [Streptantibioticus silvisoli]MDI5966205.1 discoidin domain-containing protein [Streptantibioticus silvisoli]
MRSESRPRARRGFRLRGGPLAAASVLAVMAGAVVLPAGTAQAADTLLSQGKTATASSTESASFPASAAVDGDTGTRWSSAFSDPQWLEVDLGATDTIDKVVLDWESASASSFQIQTSTDGTNWTNVYSTTTGPGGDQTLSVSGTGRYVRMYGTARSTQYGYSLYEFQVYGTAGGGGNPGSPPATSDTPNFGPNVQVFDPSQSASSIQSALDSAFNTQQSNQFGTQRNAFLFKPGTYNVNANVGFNTQVMGLGQNPDQVQINGGVTSDAQWNGGNGTTNFWREVENLSITPSSGTETWAVSQGASMRRVDVHGELKLDPSGDGWSSGGFLSDSRVSGQVFSGSQQQWMSRNDTIGSWSNGVWNQVFVGVNGAPAQSFPNPTYTTVGQTPVEKEKPYLYIDSSGNYHVFVPSLQQNTSGATWVNGNTAGTSLPMHDFYVTQPGDTAATMNAALAAGDDLLITPGVYHINQTLQVTHPDQIVMGMGLATLIPDNGVTVINTGDVDGAQIDDLLVDGGATNSASLITMGSAGNTTSHASDPQAIEDVYVRIGGDQVGKATDSLVVNANNTIGDNLWLWRADHGNGVGWTSNTADTGLIVNGANVTMYGLAVEHYQKTEVLWNGNGGRTYFFQNENPYDPPNQASWMNGSTDGYPAYEVAPGVTSHQAYGVGSYCYFNVNTSIVNDHAFQAPVVSGVQFHDLLTVSLGGVGTISHVINSTGAAANATTENIYLTSGP